jgi:hypothetical protein
MHVTIPFVAAVSSCIQVRGEITICGRTGMIEMVLLYLRRVWIVEAGNHGRTAYAVGVEIGTISTLFIPDRDSSRMIPVGLAVNLVT